MRDSTARRRVPLLDQLDGEWTRIRRRPSALVRSRAWSASAPPGQRDAFASLVADVVDLQELVDATQPAAHSSHTPATRPRVVGRLAADDVLAILVRAAGRDEIAARVVLQRLLPPLVSRSRPSPGEDFGDRVGTMVGAAWIAVRAFDPDRRPRSIAAALVSDTEWIAYRRQARRLGVETLVPYERLDGSAAHGPRADPVVELARTLQEASRSGAPVSDVELLRSLADQDGLARVATREGVTERTVRNRRSSAIAAVRQAIGDDWSPLEDGLVVA